MARLTSASAKTNLCARHAYGTVRITDLPRSHPSTARAIRRRGLSGTALIGGVACPLVAVISNRGRRRSRSAVAVLCCSNEGFDITEAMISCLFAYCTRAEVRCECHRTNCRRGLCSLGHSGRSPAVPVVTQLAIMKYYCAAEWIALSLTALCPDPPPRKQASRKLAIHGRRFK